MARPRRVKMILPALTEATGHSLEHELGRGPPAFEADRSAWAPYGELVAELVQEIEADAARSAA